MSDSKPKILHMPTPEEMAQSRLAGFARHVGLDVGALGPEGYAKLHRWSVENLEAFHGAVWDFCGIVGERGARVIDSPHSILEASFFPDSKMSFTENMLARAATHPDEPAIISRVVGVEDDRILSWAELYDAVSVWSQVLEKLGVSEGDRLATYLPHGPDAYILMMASAQLGAIFSSVGTEMGAQATAARFAQIEPKVLIAADGYTHMARSGQPGKAEDRMGLIAQLECELDSLEHIVVIPNLSEAPDLSGLKIAQLSGEILKNVQAAEIDFIRRDFNTPLAILFSSGSTGSPKCFVHGVGGTLLKHAIEHQLLGDIRAGDRMFFHSTISWMMFNWLASGLAQGATIMIYDGNPAYPEANAQLQFAAEYGCTHLGTAAAIIQDVWAKNGVSAESLNLSTLRSLMYTGSVLSDAGFEYVKDNIKAELSIEGICGGTDFVGLYASGNPFSPTLAGHMQGAALGMDIDIWNEDMQSAGEDEVGELVVKAPFASRPLCFWNDKNGSRFRAEYFDYFDANPPVWRHGDAVKRSHGQLVIEGRSDTTLNQGGVRIGTQQLYDALVEIEAIEDALAASFKDAQGGDHTALFVVLKVGALDEDLKKQIKGVISDFVGRLSTPHEILAVPYILKTPNGKRAEKPTVAALAGKEVKAPETYGRDNDGRPKVEAFVQIGKDLREKPAYGFKGSA